MGKTFGMVGVIITSQATVDGPSEQRDQVVSDIPVGTAFLEIVRGNVGKAQGIIQLWTAGSSPSEVMVVPWNSRLTFGLNWIRRSEDPPKALQTGCQKCQKPFPEEKDLCKDKRFWDFPDSYGAAMPKIEAIRGHHPRQLTASRG